jgi:hypothetical protein
MVTPKPLLIYYQTLRMSWEVTKCCAYFLQEIRKVVKEIGVEHIVHIITDNGSNYKKACKALGVCTHYLDTLSSTHCQFDVEGYR